MEHLELKKENDWNLETTNFTISDKKCGEIFVQTNEKFYIVCTFCIIRFAELEEFTTHYSHQHSNEPALYLNDPLEFIKTELEHDIEVEKNYGVENIEDVKLDDKNETVNEITLCREEMISYKKKGSKNSKIKAIKKRNRLKRPPIIYPCDLCEKTFTNEERLEDHKKYDHLPIDESFINNSSVSSEPNPNSDVSGNDEKNRSKSQNEIDPKNCRYCDRKYGTRFKRIQHERIYHKGERPFKCKLCNKTFTSLSYRTQHENIHLGIKPYECHLCHVSFVSKSNLANHLRRHTGEKPHSCSFCDKKFFNNPEKVIHERTHTGEKPFQCVNCGKCFIKSSTLFYHRKLHHITDGKSFTCEICNKSYIKKGMLLEHSKTHSDARPLSCKICNKTFKGRKGLRSHEKTHSDVTNYTCDICGKGFKQYPGWYRHIKIHEKAANPQTQIVDVARPHICDICNKSFTTKAILRGHVVSHSDVRPFKCDICGKGFKLRKVLKSHQKVHLDPMKYTSDVSGDV